MIDFLQNVSAFILALGILITFHEFGHYWVARRCGVKILRFSVGFGRPIYSRCFGDDRSEFVIAALPLGGYVKMLDEREGEVAPTELHRAFNTRPISQRFAIVVAGPMFNFIFAVFAYWVMYMVGITGLKPIVGEVEQASLAWQAGFRAGDEIVNVDGHETPTWSSVIDAIVGNVVEEQQVKFVIRAEGDSEREVDVDLSRISIDEMAGGGLLKAMGLRSKRPRVPAIIGEVIKGRPAERAGLLPGDRVIAVNGEPVTDWGAWVRVIEQNPEQPLQVELLREDGHIVIEITPATELSEQGEEVGKIGAKPDIAFLTDPALIATESYALIPAFSKGVGKTFEMSVMTLRILGKMIVGKASVKNLSGPITIAQYAGHSAGMGLATFLGFLAIVSVSLGVLNLLPIPLLDGGHLMYYLVELVKGSPVSESVQMLGQQLGLVILFSLMGLAFYNDILRLVG